jgi:beta-galactosidase/beta-glucuronidase
MPAAARNVVTFDFGWKHRTGLREWAKPDDLPSLNPDPGLHPPEANTDYNASDWMDVTLPHDGLIASKPSFKACPQGCSGKSFLPRPVLWYRKRFTIPSEWESSAVWLDFQGSFRNTTVWVNGVLVKNHVCGYTPFRLRLDNLTFVNVGSPTVVAVFCDPNNGDEGGRDRGSGWWYEGGGLYRHVDLIRTSSKIHIAQDGLFAYSNITFLQDESAKEAAVHARASIVNDEAKSHDVCVAFNLTEPNGSVVASTHPKKVSIQAGGSETIVCTMQLSSPSLWSSRHPNLYHVAVTLDNCKGKSLDSVSVLHGFRSLRYDANEGFFLNQKHFKVRGFCDHDNFAVVGMAIPERIHLFRVRMVCGR